MFDETPSFAEPSESSDHSFSTQQGVEPPPRLNSFMMGGFECTASLTNDGRRLDLLHASGHDRLVVEDYEMIADYGMRTVREGFSWSAVDRGGSEYDFSRYLPMLEAARSTKTQQIWDLSHFDFPERLDPLGPEFVSAYGEYAKRVVEILRRFSEDTLLIVPMNEPSFFSWMSECGMWAPFLKGDGILFKRQLIRAAVAAMDAIWSVDRDVRFIHADPYMFRLPARPDDARDVDYCQKFNEHVRWQSWDMISGRLEPELGGRPEFLDIIGINYYRHNQQFAMDDGGEEPSFETISLESTERLPLATVLREVHDRYRRPMIITETGSYEGHRPTWWDVTLRELRSALERGLPVYGVCSYPTLDVTPDAGFIAPRSGLWDFDPADPDCRRIPHEASLCVIREFVNSLTQNKARAAVV
jgi:beta-glucosidase/6-phospho-beta-glucosidase/beta-galactosidase